MRCYKEKKPKPIGLYLWWTNSLLLKMAIEIVDFPMNSMVDLSIAKCKRSPEGIALLIGWSMGHETNWLLLVTTQLSFLVDSSIYVDRPSFAGGGTPNMDRHGRCENIYIYIYMYYMYNIYIYTLYIYITMYIYIYIYILSWDLVRNQGVRKTGDLEPWRLDHSSCYMDFPKWKWILLKTWYIYIDCT